MKMKINRYKFTAHEVSEMREAFDDDLDRLNDALIDAARERAHKYIIPCEWHVTHYTDGSAIVFRYHNS